MATTPLSTLVTDIRLLSGLDDNQYRTDAQIVSLASDVWEELYDRIVAANQHYRIKEFSFTLVGGVGGNSVDLPADFQLGNGLELNPTLPRPRPVKYLDNWLDRNSLGASVLSNGGGFCGDRQYCLVDSQLRVFPATNSAGTYRLYYTPIVDRLHLQTNVAFAVASADVITNVGGLLAFVFTNLQPLVADMVGGTLATAFTTTNLSYNGTYTIGAVQGTQLVTTVPYVGGFTSPPTGAGALTYQLLNTVSTLPSYAEPWMLYIKLGTSIAIRESRQQDVNDLERRFAAQKQRVDQMLTNRQEEPTQPPLSGGRSFWDSL